ncbi:MAG: hypothetical protein ACRCS3_04295, partial [Paracoccaceae bacterium]
MPGPFDDLIPAGKKPAFTGYIPGTPKPRDPLDDAVKSQSLENSQQSLVNAQLEAQLKQLQIDAAREKRASADSGKPVPKGFADPYEKQIEIYTNLANSS